MPVISDKAVREIEEQIKSESPLSKEKPKGTVTEDFSPTKAETEYLKATMLIYANDRKIFNEKDPKKAASMALKEFRKWYTRRFDDVLPDLLKVVIKEIQTDRKSNK